MLKAYKTEAFMTVVDILETLNVLTSNKMNVTIPKTCQCKWESAMLFRIFFIIKNLANENGGSANFIGYSANICF